jgi:hypothetical protein
VVLERVEDLNVDLEEGGFFLARLPLLSLSIYNSGTVNKTQNTYKNSMNSSLPFPVLSRSVDLLGKFSKRRFIIYQARPLFLDQSCHFKHKITGTKQLSYFR